MKDSNETGVSNERLAEVAIQNASAQPWEVRAIFAECLAHRVANHWPGTKRMRAAHHDAAHDPPHPTP